RPDLAVEGRSAGVEDADDRPGAAPEPDLASHAPRRIARQHTATDHDLPEARPEWTARDEPHAAVHRERHRLDTADEDVFPVAVPRPPEGLVHELPRGERLAVRFARDAAESPQRQRRLAWYVARAVAGRALAENDEVVRLAGRDQHLLEAPDQGSE